MPGHWTDLFRRQLRPALIVGLDLAIFQQITGINTVIYYPPTILEAAGFNSASGGILATVGVGVVNVAMTVVAMFLVDRADRPAAVACRYRWNDRHPWRAWPEFPHLKSVRTACLDRGALPDGLCRFICDQSRTHLLAFDRRDLSAKNSRPCRGHGGHVQLGIEPDRFAYVSDVGRETRSELDVFALRVCLGGVVALRLLFCSRNEGAHVGTDRSLLESKA
jgi:hypothetical protein